MTVCDPEVKYKNWNGAIDHRGDPSGWIREDGMEIHRFQSTILVVFPDGTKRKYSIKPHNHPSLYGWLDWLNKEYPVVGVLS